MSAPATTRSTHAKKNDLKPHLNKQYVIPPEASAAFVANMEDALDVYHRPRDSECPVVCLDETSKQLIAETRVPIPAKTGRPARITTSMSAMARPTYSCCSRLRKAGATSR